ncbi:LppA family lipoprotein [Mycobacterium sp. MYCO198283]|uniref:LppA family lipoprotein n=1 Tax=Mycobacterium sp. MYCO198283 TaxID=2883505 RepID=UPI001E49F81A|nr:LppA family lipoprotein [Mycobacterium sp. MYCO198283]MCG5432958.1 LppA family lipoprotein [Mycobacterium sp. MYCO198283]
MISRAVKEAAVCVVLLAVAGCGGQTSSPIINEEVPVVDIAELPDADVAARQLTELIERARDEIVRLVPATAPWRWDRDEAREWCVQRSTGREGVTVYLRMMSTPKGLTDAEWELVFPVVARLAAEAGLPSYVSPQHSSGNHDVRFTSDDGLELKFGSREATVLTGTVACRRSADAVGRS